ncbi:MAG: hypothetical protein K2X99_06705, partial [Gemmatimonadaceae bacterium]|nr:hypothetical protein [Gemmatimonadaceae bacterium]
MYANKQEAEGWIGNLQARLSREGVVDLSAGDNWLDALRHAYWSALNARDLGEAARTWGNAHEIDSGDP